MSLSETPQHIADYLKTAYSLNTKISSYNSSENFSVAGQTIKVYAASRNIKVALTKALAHNSTASKDRHNISVRLLTSLDPNIDPVKFTWTKNDILKLDDKPTTNRPSLSYNDGRFQILSTNRNNLLFLDRNNWQASYWCRNLSDLAQHEIAAPLRSLFAWCFEDTPICMIHGSAIASSKGAILLTGASGSGKSTTAILCLEAGFDYLADDYCAINSQNSPEIFSTYCSAKLLPESFNLATVSIDQAEFDQSQSAKGILDINESFSTKLKSNAPLRAIVTCAISKDSVSRLDVASAASGLRSLAPSTLFQGSEDKKKTFDKLVTITKTVPVYSLRVARDIHRIPDLLSTLVT